MIFIIIKAYRKKVDPISILADYIANTNNRIITQTVMSTQTARSHACRSSNHYAHNNIVLITIPVCRTCGIPLAKLTELAEA